MDTEPRTSSADSDSRSIHNPALNSTSNSTRDSDRDSDRDSGRDADHDSDHDSDHDTDHDYDSDSDSEWIGFCVPSWCRLCTYPIEPNEWMVATDINGEASSPLVNDPLTIHQEVRLKEEFRPCPPACAHDLPFLKGSVPGYHVECFRYARNSPDYDFLSATAFSFEPMPSYDMEREKRTTQLVAQKICEIWRRLPLELCLMISKLVVREYTIGTLQALHTSRYQPCDSLDISKSIWARYIDIGAFKYIYELSRSGGPCFRKVYDPEITPNCNVLYVLEDHLGVQDLLFHNPDDTRTKFLPEYRKPGSWWRAITSPQKLKVEHDGVKVRRIEDEPVHSLNLRNASFLHPMPLEEIAALELSCHHLTPLQTETRLESLQMIPFQINGPGVTGYSFCWSYGLMYFHAHSEKEHNLAMYKDFDALREDPFWMHLPVTPDEYINSIWFRRAAYNSDNALWIVTNKGNEMIIGPTAARSIRPGASLLEDNPDAEIEWTRLIGPLNEGQSVRTYFNLSGRGVKIFATLQPSAAATSGPAPPSWLRSAYTADPCLWFPVTALMATVVEIIAFRKKASCSPRKDWSTDPYADYWGSHSPIIGIALVYSDGTKKFLGQWRLDCETSTHDIQHATAFYMAFRQTGIKGRNPYLSGIHLSAPSTPSDFAAAWRWVKVDLSRPDVLEWWSFRAFHSGSHVTYGDQTTFED